MNSLLDDRQGLFAARAVIGLGFLGTFPGASGPYSSANASSSDGSVVVGDTSSTLGQQAFRWTAATGLVGLGDLPGGSYQSNGNAVSGDGSVVAGFSIGASGTEAFRWTAATGMVGLGDLPGGSFSSQARGIALDGSTIVGQSISAAGIEAFVWTALGGMVGLGDLPGGEALSYARAVSGDGSVVVGSGSVEPATPSDPSQRAFVWDAAHGMRALDAILAAAGVDLGGWTPTDAWGVSADGLTIVGLAVDPSGTSQAFLAHVPEPGTALLLALGAVALSRRSRR